MGSGDSGQVAEHSQILTTEPAAVYGVWASQRKAWYTLETGEIFHTLYPAVAFAQIQHVEFRCIEDHYVVREFPPLEDDAIFRS